jgi:D-alanyl-D-alanine carboxypeptidase
VCRLVRVLALVSVLVAGCGGQSGETSAVRPATAGPAVPVSRAAARVPRAAPGTVTVAAYRARTSAIPTWMRRRMIGVSWRPGCPVGLGRLRLLRLSYWGFDHAVHQGQLVVNASAAKPLARAFRLLFVARYPIRRMRVVEVFGGSDEQSMLADNTSAFNCRRIPGTTSWSEHAYGLAVDINPFQNPEVAGGAVDPPAAAAWANRFRHSPAMIRHGDVVWRAFVSVGWQWGGDWISPKDYQHFSANGR